MATHRRTLADLIADGTIRPGTFLYGISKGVVYIATVTGRGKVRLLGGYEGSPTDTADRCIGSFHTSGNRFWHILGGPSLRELLYP